MNIDFNSVLNTLASKAKALALNVTEIELKVLDATNEDPWGPHGKDMQEIARAAEDPEKYNLIMNVISERLQMRDENWRLCYKALLLLEFLVKHGPWRVVDELNRSVSSLERLRDDFEYKDAQGRDQGINVRQRAGELAALVSNVDRVRQEREKAARNAGKFKGLSSADVRGGFGGFGGGSGGGGGYTGYSGFGGSGNVGNKPYGGAFGGTESVHVPSNYHSRNSSNTSNPAASSSTGGGAVTSSRKADAFRSSSTAGGTAEDPEDPFEATRKRIERLKAEGALPDPGPAAPPPGLVDVAAAGTKAPKKLSDVKINPAVAATFASISIPSSSSTGSLGKLAPPPPPSKPLSVVQHGSSSSLDLFAEKSESQSANAQQPGAATSAADAAWDTAFSSNPVAAPLAAADPFEAFTSNPAPAPAPAVEFDSLFHGAAAAPGSRPPPTAPLASSATSSTTARAPLPLDDFSELTAPAPTVSQPAVPAADPFGALAASVSRPSAGSFASSVPLPPRPAPAANADPFAALTSSQPAAPVPMMAAVSAKPAPVAFDAFGAQSVVKTPQPATTQHMAASDPFAALAGSSSAAPPPPPASSLPPPSAAAFDPFAPAPATLASSSASVAKPAAAFDAFGVGVPATHGPAGGGGFDDFFGATPKLNGQPAASPAAGGAPFAPSSFPSFTGSSAASSVSAANPVSAAPPAAGMAMNKSGVALGSTGHKNADPFAGLGF